MFSKVNSGFTLIEVMVVLAIVAIMLVVGVPLLSDNPNISVGLNGMVESRCIDGYKFIVDHSTTRQVMDQYGHGVTCN